jgi:hypothetical protein
MVFVVMASISNALIRRRALLSFLSRTTVIKVGYNAVHSFGQSNRAIFDTTTDFWIAICGEASLMFDRRMFRITCFSSSPIELRKIREKGTEKSVARFYGSKPLNDKPMRDANQRRNYFTPRILNSQFQPMN